jgi:EAL domain-containing protein (putative c-di-GMP-specific phosphodiesterase class I)/ActR/RegA family two-component response regulator
MFGRTRLPRIADATSGPVEQSGKGAVLVGDKTLVVIDDDDLVGQLVVEAAQQVGFVASAVQDFEALKRQVDVGEPDLMVLDLVLPNVDGIQVLRFLADRGCKAKIWLLSGFDPKVVQTAERLGVSLGLNIVGALNKPVSVTTLKEELRKQLRESGEFTVHDLEQAITDEHLFVHYQPKVRLAGDRAPDAGDEALILTVDEVAYEVIGFEALARWRNPHGALVSPVKFIPVAEHSRMIEPLTQSVFRQVIEALAQWKARGVRLNVAVNISPSTLADLDLPDRLADKAHAAGVSPEQMVLEITENSAVTEDPHFMDVLSRFRLKGFGLSLDDFGTGFSSLIQIYRMPFTELKIDRSFVSEMDGNEEAFTIVRSIVDLGHNLGMRVCAEGVETLSAANTLIDLGCDYAQGFYFSRPVALPDIMRRISAASAMEVSRRIS